MSGGTTQAFGVPFYADKNPRLRLAQFAAAFFGVQPSIVTAVTDTNGKISVAVFLRQVEAQLGVVAASMGMLGGGTKITANISGVSRVFHIGSDGAHMANNALATLLTVAALSDDVARAANQLSEFPALKERGAVFAVGLGDSSYTVIDESCNANPVSAWWRPLRCCRGIFQPHAASLRWATCWNWIPKGLRCTQRSRKTWKIPAVDHTFLCGL